MFSGGCDAQTTQVLLVGVIIVIVLLWMYKTSFSKQENNVIGSNYSPASLKDKARRLGKQEQGCSINKGEFCGEVDLQNMAYQGK